jgi:hypothetical protein
MKVIMTFPSLSSTIVSPSLMFCLALGACGEPSSAAQPTSAQKSAIRSACQTDYRTYCASVPTGGSAALSCLEKNLASLSPSCQTAVQAVGASPAAPAQPVGGESTQPAAQEPAQPVGQESTQPAAQKPPPPVPRMSPLEEIRFVRLSCGADFRALCGHVRLGGGNAVACLRANAASLSPTCRNALAGLAR